MVNTGAGETGLRAVEPKDFATGAQQHLNQEVPLDEMESASRLISELFQLPDRQSAQQIWAFCRNWRYKRVLASYCEILPVLNRPENQAFIISALVGIRHFKAKRIGIAAEIVRKIRFHVVPGEAFTYVMWGLLYFVFGLLLLAHLTLALVHTYSSGGVDGSIVNVFLSFCFGLLGSVVSLLTRIPEFEQIGTRSQAYFTYTGATSPIVGGIVAVVIAALVQSKLISIAALNIADNYWIFIVLGFLSGFSERFSGNLLRIAQDRISGPGEQERTTSSNSSSESGPVQ